MSEKKNWSDWLRNYIFIVGGSIGALLAVYLGEKEAAGTIFGAGILMHIFL